MTTASVACQWRSWLRWVVTSGRCPAVNATNADAQQRRHDEQQTASGKVRPRFDEMKSRQFTPELRYHSHYTRGLWLSPCCPAFQPSLSHPFSSPALLLCSPANSRTYYKLHPVRLSVCSVSSPNSGIKRHRKSKIRKKIAHSILYRKRLTIWPRLLLANTKSHLSFGTNFNDRNAPETHHFTCTSHFSEPDV